MSPEHLVCGKSPKIQGADGSVVRPVSPFPFRKPEGRVALVIEFDKARYAKLPFQHTPPE